MKDHNHGKIYSTNLHQSLNNESYHKRQINIDNNLKPGNYTAIFEVFSLFDDLFTNNEAEIAISGVDVNPNYQIIKNENISINNNYKKQILQFIVHRNPSDLRSEFRFYKNGRPNIQINRAKIQFYQRIVEGTLETDFDHDIFNADPNQIFFLDSLSLNNKKITDLANGTADDHAVNFSQLKSYTTHLLKLDGSRAMAGALDLSNRH